MTTSDIVAGLSALIMSALQAYESGERNPSSPDAETVKRRQTRIATRIVVLRDLRTEFENEMAKSG